MAPRPPPKVLFVHNGQPFEAHITHLIDAGFNVFSTHGEHAVREATTIQPDLVVLDFACDGETTAQLKADSETKHIPIIALVEMLSR